MVEKNFLEEFANDGYQNIGREECKIPFLRILQPLNKQCQEGSDSYIKGAVAGLFYNTITNKLYGKTIKVIPIDFDRNWLEWKPNRGGFVASHIPDSIKVDKSQFNKWLTLNGNIITEHYNFYCLIADHLEDDIVIFSMSSSSICHAKNWNSLISYTKLGSGQRAPYYSSVWELETSFNQNDKGNWFSIGNASKTNIKRERFITEDEFKISVSPAIELLRARSQSLNLIGDGKNTDDGSNGSELALAY